MITDRAKSRKHARTKSIGTEKKADRTHAACISLFWKMNENRDFTWLKTKSFFIFPKTPCCRIRHTYFAIHFLHVRCERKRLFLICSAFAQPEKPLFSILTAHHILYCSPNLFLVKNRCFLICYFIHKKWETVGMPTRNRKKGVLS